MLLQNIFLKKPILEILIGIPEKSLIPDIYAQKGTVYSEIDEDINEREFPFTGPSVGPLKLVFFQTTIEEKGSLIEKFCLDSRKINREPSYILSAVHDALSKHPALFKPLSYGTILVPVQSLDTAGGSERFLPKFYSTPEGWCLKGTNASNKLTPGTFVAVLADKHTTF